MFQYCYICHATKKESPLHKFPNPALDPERFTVWLHNCGGPIRQHDNEYIYKHHKICKKHFEEKFYNRFERLNAIAIPTLLLKVPNDVAILNFKRTMPTIYKGSSRLRYEKRLNSETVDPSASKSSRTCRGDHTYTPYAQAVVAEVPPIGNNTQTNSKNKLTKQVNESLSMVMMWVPSEKVAHNIADAVVADSLAATVHVLPGVTSVYKCNGRIKRNAKIVLMAKTRSSNVNNLCEFVRSRHPMNGHQIISMPIDNGNSSYLNWINKNVTNYPDMQT